ncbi:hypothetical protein GYMLUDRAFT_263303 [Collybiopsis luxurians FD-317 M1]|uniref:Uncharacterized protein n=1 Tax=Collybiopsis luxurians FD-317 M1 TaxID=944289 RepID=A0A0D0CPJ2_9AGAR|nr:hypothetical protein GYMLUDRAFT_263303 [Collybiopsis luxurians FD-317 M1]
MTPEYKFVINLFIVVSVSVLLYGVHLMLFMNAIYLLARKHKAQAHRYFHIVALTVLLLLATVAVIVGIIGSAGGIALAVEVSDKTITTEEQFKGNAVILNILEDTLLLFYSLTNTVADTILLLRLYTVWGRQKRIVVVPVIVVILNNILAILVNVIRLRQSVKDKKNQSISKLDDSSTATIMTITFMIVTLSVNALVTGLIAGRIWWISRKINASYGHKGTQQKYRRAIAIILESGMLYPVLILITVIIGVIIPESPTLSAILAEVVAIAPTLIIVRVAKGITVSDVKTAVHDPGTARLDTGRAEGGGIDAREKLLTVRFASGEANTQLTSGINLTTHASGDTFTSEDSPAINTYHTAQSKMSTAPAVNVTSPGQVHSVSS